MPNVKLCNLKNVFLRKKYLDELTLLVEIGFPIKDARLLKY